MSLIQEDLRLGSIVLEQKAKDGGIKKAKSSIEGREMFVRGAYRGEPVAFKFTISRRRDINLRRMAFLGSFLGTQLRAWVATLQKRKPSVKRRVQVGRDERNDK